MGSRALQADCTYINGQFERDIAVVFESGTGRIVQTVPAGEVTPDVKVERCTGRALLPGMVNAHSHAFQRVIRGWTQWRLPAGKSDFWSWRDAMYRSVLRLSPEDVYRVSRFCFTEMLLAGYTTAGEFHYLQRDEGGQPYANPNELALQVVRAAIDTGIRIVILNVCYATGGVGEALKPEQRRFATPDLDRFLSATDGLRHELQRSPLASAGVAPHSVRAVPRAWLAPIAEFARRRGLPLHMHVSEQPAEVEASVAHYGLRPIEMLAEAGLLSASFTAVHAIHMKPFEIDALGRASATVCACPTTERDLGDGTPHVRELMDAGTSLCIGSDSQTVIDPWEELRSIEYQARLAELRRVVLAEVQVGERLETAPVLMRAGTAGGAGALGMRSGNLEPGEPADFVLVDLEHPALAGWNRDTLGAHLTLSAPASVVRDVWVGGVARVRDGRHDSLPLVQHEFNQVCKRVLT